MCRARGLRPHTERISSGPSQPTGVEMLLAQAETWGDKLRNGFEEFFDFIPNLVACLAVLVIGYIVARLVAAAIARLLDRAGLDTTLTR